MVVDFEGEAVDAIADLEVDSEADAGVSSYLGIIDSQLPGTY